MPQPDDHANPDRTRNARSRHAGIAAGLDPLSHAQRIQERASAIGFDWSEPGGALDKVIEELGEVRALLAADAHTALEDELGDLLFAAVNLTRLAGCEATRALQRANAKFARRFERIERLARERGIDLAHASLEAMDALWDEVKRGETTNRER